MKKFEHLYLIGPQCQQRVTRVRVDLGRVPLFDRDAGRSAPLHAPGVLLAVQLRSINKNADWTHHGHDMPRDEAAGAGGPVRTR